MGGGWQVKRGPRCSELMLMILHTRTLIECDMHLLALAT